MYICLNIMKFYKWNKIKMEKHSVKSCDSTAASTALSRRREEEEIFGTGLHRRS